MFKNELGFGGARRNLFRVDGIFPGESVAAAGLNPSNKIRFLVRAASLPEANLGVCTVPFQGRYLKLAGDRAFAPWSITVYNDNDFSLRNAFERWSDIMNRIESNVGRNGLASYAFDWTVTQIDREGRDVKKYSFVDCWPSVVSSIDLDQTPATEIETFQVTLQYQYYRTLGTTS